MIINFLIFLIVNLWLSAQSSQPLERDIRTGNFSISSGAVYGQMGWEIAKDIVSDGNNIYVLVENSPRHYIIKYDMEGNIISTKTIGILGSESFTNLFITSNNIYIIGNDYSNSSKPGVIIIKQNKDLVLISSDTFYAGSNGLEFKSGVIDANYLYVCVDEVATIFAKQARLRKIDLTNLTVDSYNYYNFSSYSCGNYMFIRSGKLYTILKDSLYKTYISYSVLSNINTQTINELQIPFVPNSFYVATNSNFFVITQLTPDSETTIYKYDYTDFNSLNPLNVTKQINGQLRTATSTNSSLLLGYSRYNPVTNIEGYYIASLDPSSLDLINDVELYTQGNTTIRTIFPLYSVSGSTAYIVGVSYICKNWGCDNDVRTVRFYNFDVSMNKPPLLNFPISYRYSGGIEQGNVVALNQGVTFYIEYFDINNHDPEYVRLNIKHENENFYTNLNMTCISNCNSNRRLYALNNIFTIPGRYTYYFTAKESTTTEKYEAGGYPVENRLNFLVLKGFDGSFADNDNTIELKIPYSKNSEHKIFSFNQNLYALLNPNVGVRNNNTTERIDAPSIIVNLSTSPSMSNRFYDFNLNWPNTNSSNRLGWVIYDAEFNEKGNIEVIAASKTITDSYNIFFATVSPQIINNEISFNIVGTSVIVQNLNVSDIPKFCKLKYKNATRYVLSDDYTFIKCDNNCSIYDLSDILDNNGFDEHNINDFFISSNYAYFVGYYIDTSTQTALIVKIDLNTGNIVKAFKFRGFSSLDKGEFNSVIIKDNYLFALGTFSTPSDNYGILFKFDNDLKIINTKIFNYGKREFYKKLTNNNSNIVIGGTFDEISTNLKQMPFIVTVDSETLNFVKGYKDDTDEINSFNIEDMLVLNNGDLYYVKSSSEGNYLSMAKYRKIDKTMLEDDRVQITINVKNNNGTPIKDAKVSLIPFEEGKVDLVKTIFGPDTNLSGNTILKVPKNIQYFIAVSTEGYSPTIRQQFFDPYKRFIKNFNFVSNISYVFSSSDTKKYSVIISSLIKGVEIFGSINFNNEIVALSLIKATDTVVTMDFYGVSIDLPNKYKLDISIPDLLNYSQIITSTHSSFIIDFSSATPPKYAYEEVKVQEAIYKGQVLDETTNMPISGAIVAISTGCCNPPLPAIAMTNTDLNGRFSFYLSTSSLNTNNIYVTIKKTGYIPIWNRMRTIFSGFDDYFTLLPATYSISGYLTNNGIPISGVKIEAGGYSESLYSFSGTDSYAQTNNVSYVNSYAITDANGYFVINGLKDGNIALRVQNPFWKELNMGGDNQSNTADDIRIVISSAGAIPPSFPENNICLPGRVWILNKSGRCIGITPYTFDIANEIGVNEANVNLTVNYDTLNSTETSATILFGEDCYDNCQNAVRRMFSLPNGLVSGTTTYTINLPKNKKYWIEVVSDKWTNRGINDTIRIGDDNEVNFEMILTRSGGLRVKILKPDGSIYIPKCNYQDCRWPRIYVQSLDGMRSYDDDFWTDNNEPNPVFELPNILPGKYSIMFTAEGYPPIISENVVVEVGKTTEVKLKLKDGLVIKPNITSLPQSIYNYAILAVPSGFEMKRKNMNSLLFSQSSGSNYVVDYDTTTQTFLSKYLNEGSYDFYLVLASVYNPDDQKRPISFRSFVNFLGVEKNKSIQKDLTNLNYGTIDKPISDFNIYGSIGKSSLTGKITGKYLITSKDYEKIFSGNFDYLISLIPSVMLYDDVGNLRGYAHCIMDNGQALNNFLDAITQKSTTAILSIFNSSSTYFIPSLPNGRYTAVFTSPNYPPISKEIFINGNTTFDFDFDSQNYISAKVNINVVDESSSSVKGAKVILIHKTFEETAYTNDNGNCSFENIPTGLYKLEIHKDGYTSQAIKFSLNNQPINYKFILKPSLNSIKGKVYLSKFPKTSFSAGVLVSAYNETKISEGSNYVPSIKVYTEEDGSYEIKNVESGSVYRIVASYPGKLTQTTSVRVSTTSTTTYAEDIVFMDIPPQIDVKIKRYKNNIELYIKSPKEIANVPICKYIPGKYNIDNFDESNAVQLSLVKMPNNTYLGKFNISSLQNYYTIKVQVGDIDIVEKVIVYDVINDIANENYIYDKIYFGGNVYADSENNDYTGIEIDPGVFSQSTSTIVLSSYYKNIKIHNFGDGLIGGFFSALPSVKTTRTSKGEFTISQTIKDLMASDIYEIEISNVQPNKEFTLTLAYDKEKVITNTSNLRIYQYNENTSRWEEIIGTYTIDPMLGTVSVDVVSISNAYETNKVDITNPFMRERLGMSALIDGRFVPQNTQSSQKGKFAVFSAKPPTGTSYVGNTFEIYNIPNPFNLELKPVNISSDGGSWYTGLYQTQGTIIKYHLPQGKDGKIKLVIYNISGEKVRTIDEGYRAGGYVYYSEWDGRNDKNEKVSSGVYFLVTYLNGEKLGGIHKMAVIK